MIRLEIKVGNEIVYLDTHQAPHLDEICAKWLIEKFGNKKFFEKYAPERVIKIGVEGGVFDEHPKFAGQRKKDECAATLVAKALGVSEDPCLKEILEFVRTHDLKTGPFEVGDIVNLIHQQFPDNPKVAVNWARMALEAKYQRQLRFFAAKERFEPVEIEEVKIEERMLKIAIILSDEEEMSKVARSSYGGKAAIVIQKKSSGNVSILTNPRLRPPLHLRDVARMIRFSEQETKGKIVTRDWRLLGAEGKAEGAEEWYYYPVLGGEGLFNGSHIDPNLPPTKLSLEKIKELVKIGINPLVFEPSRSQKCLAGTCTSTRADPCPWYHWGLERCQKIRSEKRRSNFIGQA